MSESIAAEYVVKARDKRGGHMVNFCRTKISGRRANTVWKELRFLDGKFEKWPGRWSTQHVELFTRLIAKTIEENAALLDTFERFKFRDQEPEEGQSPEEFLLKDITALAATPT